MLATEKSNRHGMKNWMRAVQRRVSSLRSGRMAMDGAAALYSCSRVGARRLLRSDPVLFFGKNLSRARNLVARLDAATATARSCHLHGHTQHTVASVTI